MYYRKPRVTPKEVMQTFTAHWYLIEFRNAGGLNKTHPVLRPDGNGSDKYEPPAVSW